MFRRALRVLLAAAAIALGGAAFAMDSARLALGACGVAWCGTLYFVLERPGRRLLLLLPLACAALMCARAHGQMGGGDWLRLGTLLLGIWLAAWLCEALLGRFCPPPPARTGLGMLASRILTLLALAVGALIVAAPALAQLPEIRARVSLDERLLASLPRAAALAPAAYCVLMALRPSIWSAIPASALLLAAGWLVRDAGGAVAFNAGIAFSFALIVQAGAVSLDGEERSAAPLFALLLPLAALAMSGWHLFASFDAGAWLFRLRALEGELGFIALLGAIGGALLFAAMFISRLHWAVAALIFAVLGALFSLFAAGGLPWTMNRGALACAVCAYLLAWFATIAFGREKRGQ